MVLLRVVKQVFAMLVVTLVLRSSVAGAAQVDYQRDIQPLLKRHCDRCHGASNQEASLSFADRQSLLGVADSDEPIVVPHSAEDSLLIKRVTDEEYGDLMPLDGQPLSQREIALLRQWIDDGASMPLGEASRRHWAYERPIVAADQLKQARDAGAHPIDYFVERRLAEVGLSAEPHADRATLARRTSLALTGLPATPEQIDQLLRDDSEEAFSRYVDELLASEAFGVHWARHWLDLARYADSNGFQADQLRDSWAYRDWVVDAFNQDKPFDRFVIEQLAGDLLPDANAQTRIATGFHRTPTCNVEAGVDPESNRVQQVFDRVNTTATVFLGATMECAQCHDHKYDPFTQRDYYQLFAYFNNTPMEVEQTAGVTYDFVGPKMDLPLPAAKQSQLDALRSDLVTLRSKRRTLVGKKRFEAWRTKTRDLIESLGRAQWIAKRPVFSATADEEFEILEDHSVLLNKGVPGSTVYTFELSGIQGPMIGIRIDALRHDSLPGGGPGKGDAERTNFVLHEIDVAVHSGDDRQSVALAGGKASFSQSGWDVSGAVDGNSKTGWAIAPKFKEEHWATFRLVEPRVLKSDDKVVISLDQHFGRGRVMGRTKVSLLVGPAETAELTDEVVAMLMSDEQLKPAQLKQLKRFHQEHDSQVLSMDRRIKAVENELKQIEPRTTLVMVEQQESRETFVMLRGDYQAKGEAVAPGTPAVLHPLNAELPPNRLGLARWIVDPANPLLSRVTVNRFWGELFGRSLVTTPEDFGTQAESPSHPQLLDWLALEFQSNGWSIKSLLKTIVMSAAFRRSSTVSSTGAEVDPANALLSRGPRYRLSAEAVRDNALFVAGLLDQQPGGPPIMPFQPDGIWRSVGRNQPKWKAATTSDRYRRGLYVVWKRAAPYPSFVTFDAPDRAACTVKRPRTNTPLQALVLLNDQAYAEASVGLAQRMLAEAKTANPRDIAAFGYRLATAQFPSEQTVAALVGLYEAQLEAMKAQPEQAKLRIEVLPESFRRPKTTHDDVTLAAWYAVANALLNLDRTITLN